MKKSFFIPERQKYIKLTEGYLNIYNHNKELASSLISMTREVTINNKRFEQSVDSSQFLYQRYLKVELLLIYCLKEYEKLHSVSLGLNYTSLASLLSYSPDFPQQKYYFKYPTFSRSECAIEASEINFIECKRLKKDLQDYNLAVKELKKVISKHKDILSWEIGLPQESMFNSWKTIDITFEDLLVCYKTLDFDMVGHGAVKLALDLGPNYFINEGNDIKELSKAEEDERYVIFVNNRFIPNSRVELEKGLEPTISTAKTFSTLDLAQKTALKYAYNGEYAIIKIHTKALEVCVNTLAQTGDTKSVVSSIEAKTAKKQISQELSTLDASQELIKMKEQIQSYQALLAQHNIEDPHKALDEALIQANITNVKKNKI